jgi:GTP cyclohydrolase I
MVERSGAKIGSKNGSRVYSLIHDLFQEIGVDFSREELKKTPERFVQTLSFFTQGYHENPDEMLASALFPEPYSEMVIVRDIDFYSLCEHHLLPFFGKCHIAYIPNGNVVGLSKMARLVEIFSRRLQVQERMTVQIAEALYKNLKPMGAGVVVEAQHLCMIMRGVQKQNSAAVTSSLLGAFQKEKVRMEFLELIRK